MIYFLERSMNSNTLYLKYRPQTLDEVVGQEELVYITEEPAAVHRLYLLHMEAKQFFIVLFKP